MLDISVTQEGAESLLHEIILREQLATLFGSQPLHIGMYTQ